MFTGIVEEVGTIKSINRGSKAIRLSITAKKVLEDIKIGDSIATNGVCLTVTESTNETFAADVMPETLRRSNLRTLKVNSKVNLERALSLGDRLGGHMVSGHVDGVAKLIDRKTEDNAEIFTFQIVEQISNGNINKYLIEKGSITIDGISLTITDCSPDKFSVSIIPHSKETTTLGSRTIGDEINIEVDLIGKYVEKMLSFESSEDSSDKAEEQNTNSSIDINRLRQLGF